MADLYVRATGSNTAPYDTWAKAATSFNTAASAAAAGDRIFVPSGYSESMATDPAWAFAGTAGSPVLVIGVDDTGDPQPPTAMAATKPNLYGAAGINITVASGWAVFVNMWLMTDNNMYLASGASAALVFEDSKLELSSAGTNKTIYATYSATSANSGILLLNTEIAFSSTGTGKSIDVRNNFVWLGGVLTLGVAATLFNTANRGAVIKVADVDLSSANLSYLCADDPVYVSYDIQRCKIPSGFTPRATAIAHPGFGYINMEACDDGTNNKDLQLFYEDAYGTVVTEYTLIRTGGSSDGTTGYSFKFTTNASAKNFVAPLRKKIACKYLSAGAHTFTAEILHDSLTNLQDDEVWIEIEAAESTGTLGSRLTDRAASVLATPADQTASSATWTTTGMTNPNKQSLSKSVTLGKASPVNVYVCVAKPSYTLYSCGLVDIT